MGDVIKRYQKDGLEVVWQPGICTHSGICARSLGEVFNPKRRPWIDLNAADQQSIIDTVKHCPSGALSLGTAADAPAESKSKGSLVSLKVVENGPVLVQGEVTITLADGSEKSQKSMALCRCGESANKPFCDGSHSTAGFKG